MIIGLIGVRRGQCRNEVIYSETCADATQCGRPVIDMATSSSQDDEENTGNAAGSGASSFAARRRWVVFTH
ncbi:MAG TPA: hypothetical protein PKY22_07245 [Accumulibacter sp.]|nr:hypothetical protein [Accumulibacter sp.]